MSSTGPLLTPHRLAAALAAVNALAAAYAGNPTYYVDDDAPPGGDGTSWNTAFRDLQDALGAVRNAHLHQAEIRIAEGVYTPDHGTLDRTASFAIASGVSLIGGFAGLGAANPDAVDPARFVSVLSGDLRRDDAPGFANRGDNSYHVVDVTDASLDIRLDGLTIRGGQADGRPDLDDRGSAVIGLWGLVSGIDIVRCTITENFASNGAAVYLDYGWLNLTDSLVAANRTVTHRAAGVAIPGYLTITRSRFAGNVNAPGPDAGSAVESAISAEILDSLFDGNGVASPVLSASGSVHVNRCTIADNATGDAGAIRLDDSSYASIGGVILRNAAPGSPEIVARSVDHLWIGSSCIAGGMDAVRATDSTVDWYSGNIDVDPLFADPDGADDDPAAWQDNDYSLRAGSACIDVGNGHFPSSTTDLAGNLRAVAGRGACARRTDMGAYEFQGLMPPPAPLTVFVRADAPPGGDGLSWTTALSNVTDALATPGVREIRVAAGTYTPDADEPRASLEIQCQISLLGGFAGSGPDPDQRDPQAFPTILSGDLLANDNDTPESLQDNSYTILSLYTADALIDGFTIERSHGPDPINGGASAINSQSSTLRLSHCTVQDCTYDGDIGTMTALWSDSSDLTVEGCTFARNRVQAHYYAAGAAITFYSGDLAVSDSVFEDNAAHSAQHSYGGAIACGQAGSALFVNCLFARNAAIAVDADRSGYAGAGALYASADDLLVANCRFAQNQSLAGELAGVATVGAAELHGPSPNVGGCVFVNNVARGYTTNAGALIIAAGQEANLANSTIVGNRVVSSGGDDGPGGVLTSTPPMNVNRVDNTILWGNSDSSGHSFAAQITCASGNLQVPYCCIEGWDESVPGVHTFDADPLFDSSDDLRLMPGSPCIDAGRRSALRRDTADLDHDHDTSEPTPLDAANLPRVSAHELDIGAFETQFCPADYNADAAVNSSDLFDFLNDFFAQNPRADFNADAVIDSRDVFAFLNAFFLAC
jgi:hypothetical protein